MRRMPLIAALALCLAPGLFAAPAWNWSTSLDTIVGTGDTRYLMEEPGSPYGVSSELIFPLDTLLAGVSFRGDRYGGRRDWGFGASLAVSLLAPFGKMEDYDWYMIFGVPKVPFSYTESNATMLWLTASAAWKLVLVSGGWGSLNAVLGYRFQYVSQEINGYNGWVFDDTDTDGQPELYTQSGTGVVLTYWVLWNVPTAGLSIALRPAAAVTVQAEAGLAVPYVADEDDHVLRHKLSTASGLGFGAYANLGVRYSWGKSRMRPFLCLSMDAMTLKANTEQTQKYYSGATEAPPGYRISGIDHQISTRQLAVALTGGVQY